MKEKERDHITYLEDMEDAMEKVSEYIHGYDRSSFLKDSKTVDAMVRNFEVIGEASKKLPQRVKDENPEMPWEEMYRLRNKASHEYFGMDHGIVWDIATRYLPEDLKRLKEILRKEKES